MAQGVGGEIEREAFAGELVGQHVAGVPGVGADLQERSHGPDEFAMGLDDGGAAGVLVEVVGDGAVGIAQRREVVKLHLGAFDGERLGVGGRGQTLILARGLIVPSSNLFTTFARALGLFPREVVKSEGFMKQLSVSFVLAVTFCVQCLDAQTSTLITDRAAARFLDQATWGPTPASIAQLQQLGIASG